ncbi:MAG: protein-L-isoaspartate O-methyltransferase [Gammaproteobacteria bacterium]|nr:protein-L-isoaspartate O-methyltransferase [Gammaproteobacteria bacterium]
MPEVNVDVARQNMVESQIRTWEVLDPRVIELLARAPREQFVPERFHSLAYADLSLPLGRGQVMMTPKLEARLLQALEVGRNDRILEIGTGSGYMTWLLAALGGHVFSVEIIPEFKMRAAAKLAALGVTNVTFEVGDGSRGWGRHQPYDAILLTGSVPVLADAFRNSLAVGGRLVAVVGEPPVMEAMLVRRTGPDSFTGEPLFETDLAALINASEPEKFVF